VAGGDRRSADTLLVAALASGQPILEAARTAGISERTAYRRLQDARFRREVADARAGLLAQAVGQLADATTAAVSTLRALLDAEAETVRLGAARSILDTALRGAEFCDLAERVRVLEGQAEAVRPARGMGQWSA
jgi:hypothetical protein